MAKLLGRSISAFPHRWTLLWSVFSWDFNDIFLFILQSLFYTSIGCDFQHLHQGQPYIRFRHIVHPVGFFRIRCHGLKGTSVHMRTCVQQTDILGMDNWLQPTEYVGMLLKMRHVLDTSLHTSPRVTLRFTIHQHVIFVKDRGMILEYLCMGYVRSVIATQINPSNAVPYT